MFVLEIPSTFFPMLQPSLLQSLQADHKKISDIVDRLEMPPDQQLLDLVITHKEESDELQKISTELQVPTGDARSMIIDRLIPRDQELADIHRALGHSEDQSALALIQDLKEIENEHAKLMEKLGSPQKGTVSKFIDRLTATENEHQAIYEALDQPPKGKAVEVIASLYNVKEEHVSVYEALESPEGKAVEIVRDLKEIEADHGKIYAALG